MRRPLESFATRTRPVLVVALLLTAVAIAPKKTEAQSGTAGVCFCDETDSIAIAQLITAVNIALGRAACPDPPAGGAVTGSLPALDGICFCNDSGEIGISQLVTAVNIALGRTACPPLPQLTPTPEATPTASATATATPQGLLDLGLTVVDLDAGLEWVKTDDDGGLTDKDNVYSWSASGTDSDGTVFSEYIDGLNAATYAGHRDWRLPTSAGSETLPTGQPAEIESILDCSFSQCIDPVFGPVGADVLWAGSEFVDTTAWAAVLDTGAVVADGKANRYGARAVRSIKGDDVFCEGRVDGVSCGAGIDGVVRTCFAGECGDCFPSELAFPRFIDNFDGTVTDQQQCLVWERKTGEFSAEVPCPDLATCPNPHDVNNIYVWSETGTAFDGPAKTLFLDLLNDVAGGGNSCFADHCDWRLPKVGILGDADSPELETIWLQPFPCDTSPCIDTFVFGPTAPFFYWATTDAEDPEFVCGSSAGNAIIGCGIKIDDNYVRAVRGGG